MNVDYPQVAFAFNPITIKVDGLNDKSVVTLSHYAPDGNFTKIKREIRNGAVTYDVQAFAQSLFNRNDFHGIQDKDVILHKTLIIGLFYRVNEEEEGDTIEMHIDVIWGALQIGEVYSQTKTLTWFKNLPFTFPLLLSESKQVLARYDKNQYSPWRTLEAGKHNLTPVFPDATNKVVFRISGEGGGVFDYIFDYTFRRISASDIVIKLNVVECTQGIYLRWINRHGEYCYYLFNSGNESNAISNLDIDIQEFFTKIDYSNNYHPGTNSIKGKKGQKSVKLFAPLIDKDTYKFLESLPESVVVDLLTGYDDNGSAKWVGVNIAAGTFTKGGDVLQDFECTLNYPTTQLPSL